MITTLIDLELLIVKAKQNGTDEFEHVVVYADDNRLTIAQRFPIGDCSGPYGPLIVAEETKVYEH